MSISSIAIKAYSDALKSNDVFKKEQQGGGDGTPFASFIEQPTKSLGTTITDSLGKVQGLETQKTAMIESFVSGQEHNVHELMITMQKAGLAVGMTAAVRGKVLETYKQLMQMQI